MFINVLKSKGGTISIYSLSSRVPPFHSHLDPNTIMERMLQASDPKQPVKQDYHEVLDLSGTNRSRVTLCGCFLERDDDGMLLDVNPFISPLSLDRYFGTCITHVSMSILLFSIEKKLQ